jgi:17beta-estradiol 17-dehydrogenase / very-long-chain 3-oxoacyl-CoA reductase
MPSWGRGGRELGFLVTARRNALARWVYAAFLRPARPLRRRYGEWAVVTGATYGIGRALVFCLAASGLGRSSSSA